MLYVILVAFFVFVYLYLFILYYIVIVLILFAIATLIDFRFICIVRVLSLFVTVYTSVWFVSIVARRSAGAELLLGAAALRLIHKLHDLLFSQGSQNNNNNNNNNGRRQGGFRKEEIQQ